MPASYPNSIVTLASHSDTTDTIFAADINTPNAEIVAVETGLLNGFQHDLLPLNDDAKSIGSTSKRWLKLWAQDADIDGTLTLASSLTVPSGGTGVATLTNHGVLLGQGTSAVSATAVGGASQALVGNASADPSFQNIALVLDKSLTEQIITNTNVETAFYTKSVLANTLVAGTGLRLSITGTPVNTSGGSINFTIAVKLGSTTVFTVVIAVGNGTSITPWNIDVLINANNASNSQRGTVFIHYITTNISDGTASAGVVPIGGGHSAMAVDMTTNQTLQATVTMASAASTISFKRWAALLESF